MMTFGIHWANFNSIHYFYALLPFLFLLTYRLIKVGSQRKMLVADRYLSLMLHNYSCTKKIIKNILIFIGTLFLFGALLRPQWDKQEQVVVQEGRDLLIAIDISRSMLAQDVKPNRLTFAKEKIKKLLYNLSCERVGLIVFSASTIVQCPLTTDFGSFFLFLDQLDVDTISQGTTAIDEAIKSSLGVFESIPGRKTKLLMIFTDGEDFSANLEGVKNKVLEDKLSIFTVGLGTAHGAPIPILNEKNKQIGWEKDERGHVIMSRLNENLLAKIASQSGGKYVRAIEGDDDIMFLINSINKFEKDILEDKTFDALQEQYPYFIIISFICFALEWIL
ncbi:VWA domain-containing protein [Candidatus Babeliales bacterium]|nr:VWA domain-containing protein [Candidatus Babeliales bacterium]MBP9843789.1 VWA domain-containing protein [Candidatus Babeliales bacterium]